MNVKELITALLECGMDAPVAFVSNEWPIEDNELVEIVNNDDLDGVVLLHGKGNHAPLTDDALPTDDEEELD